MHEILFYLLCYVRIYTYLCIDTYICINRKQQNKIVPTTHSLNWNIPMQMLVLGSTHKHTTLLPSFLNYLLHLEFATSHSICMFSVHRLEYLDDHTIWFSYFHSPLKATFVTCPRVSFWSLQSSISRYECNCAICFSLCTTLNASVLLLCVYTVLS